MASEHADVLVLKVMRLRRPMSEAPASICHGGSESSDAPKLLLPMSVTQTLVGEPFSGYLHLSNQGGTQVTNVVMRVELQIGTSKYVLFNNIGDPVSRIDAGGHFDADVEHELRDAGTYVLTCNVSYNIGAVTEPILFKRSYRFPALQPFAVTHRVAQLDTQLIVECTVSNATAGSIRLSSARLDCAEGFEASLVGPGTSSAGGSSGSTAQHPHLLGPRGVHRIIFTVVPRTDTIDVAYCRDLRQIGCLALGWHVPDGASGIVEGHQICVEPCSTSSLDLRVVSCPKRVCVEEPFQIEVEIVNRSGKAMEPCTMFDLRLMAGVKVHGCAKQAVGRLEPYCTTRLPIQLFAVVPGMHALRGVSVEDKLSKARCDVDVLCDVLAF